MAEFRVTQQFAFPGDPPTQPSPTGCSAAASWLADRAFVCLVAGFHDHPFEINRIIALTADP